MLTLELLSAAVGGAAYLGALSSPAVAGKVSSPPRALLTEFEGS